MQFRHHDISDFAIQFFTPVNPQFVLMQATLAKIAEFQNEHPTMSPGEFSTHLNAAIMSFLDKMKNEYPVIQGPDIVQEAERFLRGE